MKGLKVNFYRLGKNMLGILWSPVVEPTEGEIGTYAAYVVNLGEANIVREFEILAPEWAKLCFVEYSDLDLGLHFYDNSERFFQLYDAMLFLKQYDSGARPKAGAEIKLKQITLSEFRSALEAGFSSVFRRLSRTVTNKL